MSVTKLRTKLVEQNMDQRKWELCAALAEDIFTDSAVSSEDKAFAGYALCRSLSNLDRYTAALEPGQAASVLAGENRDYELLARTLLELAYVQGHIPGQEIYAINTLHKFLFFQYRFIGEAQQQIGDVLHNLAIVERACLKQTDALEHDMIRPDGCGTARLSAALPRTP